MSESTSKTSIRMIVGLGNPGNEHRDDRHNAGYWYVDALARKYDSELRPERKFFGETGRFQHKDHDLRLIKPDTWMNRSGSAVQAMSSFLKIRPEEILVAHDELDLPPGTVRLKKGGGAGGHNGLKDIIQHIGPDFARLRIGIGHPGEASRVTSYVLSRPTSKEEELIHESIDAAVKTLALLLGQGFERAMHKLHSRGSKPKPYRKKNKAEASNDGKAADPAGKARGKSDDDND